MKRVSALRSRARLFSSPAASSYAIVDHEFDVVVVGAGGESSVNTGAPNRSPMRIHTRSRGFVSPEDCQI